MRQSRRVRIDEAIARAQKEVRGRIRAMLGPDARREVATSDVVQSAVLSAWRREQANELSWRGSEAFLGWVVQAARNKIRNRARRGRQRAVEPAKIGDVSARSPTPSQEVERREAQDLLSACMDSLKKSDRQALKHYFVLELRGRELGESLGLSASAADHRVSRALGRLKKAVRESRD